MNLGFLTACLPRMSLAGIADFAQASGFDALEVAAWPRVQTRGFQASHIDVANFAAEDAAAVRAMMAERGLAISAIGYYENNLHNDPAERQRIHDHLKRCIDAAALLQVDIVGTFIGRDNALSVQDNLSLGEKVLPELVSYAGDRGIRLAVENCPMEGWHPDSYPGNLAYSPELWEWMFELGFYLNFDPSHLVWLGIDPVAALRPHLDRVIHTQAKDTEVDPHSRNRYGVFGKTRGRSSSWDVGWWRYRVPGRGQVDWRAVIDVLDQGGYQGTVSIEHEDPVWSGTDERTMQGLLIAHQTLRPLVIR